MARTVDADPGRAEAALDELAAAGIDMADVARTLEEEGVAAFEQAFVDVLAGLAAKAVRLG